MTETAIIIPARYGSSRLEGKPLIKVEEKPVSKELFERGVCLPSDTNMTKEDQNRVINIIKKLWE